MAEVPAEFRGRARALIRAASADMERRAKMHDLLDARVTQRMTARPGATMRRSLVRDIEQRWRRDGDTPYRVHFEVKGDLKSKRWSVEEFFFESGKHLFDDATEDEIAVASLRLWQDSQGVMLKTFYHASFGLHAIARRYERGRDRSDDAVVHDLKTGGLIEPLDEALLNKEVRVQNWRGLVGRCRMEGPSTTTRATMFLARTWYEDEG